MFATTFRMRSALCAALLSTLAASAHAQVGVTADLGSTGAGLHLVVPMERNLNGRFGFNAFQHDFDRTSNGIAYEIKGKLRTVDVLFDWYVREGSSFHLTGGVVYNGNQFDARATPDALGKIQVNGTSYTATGIGTLNGRIDYRKAAPYLGIGWGNSLDAGHKWNVGVDAGAFYQGHPNVQLTSVGCTTSAALCSTLVKDVAAERLRLLDDVDTLKWYPVLRVSIGYRF